jgi:hypothetical protein
MAAAVAHHPADLFALQVAVDTCHPGVDLSEQQSVVGFDHMIGPGLRRLGRRVHAGQAAVARMTDQRRDPVGRVFHSAREISQAGVRAHHHHEIGEPVHQVAQQRSRPVAPFLLQRHAIDAADIDEVESAGAMVDRFDCTATFLSLGAVGALALVIWWSIGISGVPAVVAGATPPELPLPARRHHGS